MDCEAAGDEEAGTDEDEQDDERGRQLEAHVVVAFEQVVDVGVDWRHDSSCGCVDLCVLVVYTGW